MPKLRWELLLWVRSCIRRPNVLPIAKILQFCYVQKWTGGGRSKGCLLIANLQPTNFLHMDHSLKRP